MKWTIKKSDWNPNKIVSPEEEKKNRIAMKKLHTEANKRMIPKLRERMKK
jgi:hypothetical protein